MIRARTVRVIDQDGKQLGILDTRKAADMAAQAGYDLVEVSPDSVPPVCRIMDYGKFLYTQEKRDRQARKKHKTVSVKEIVLRPGTDVHDYNVKLRNLRAFLEEGHKAKIVVRYRGRELAHMERGRTLLDRLTADLGEAAVVEYPPSVEGKRMIMVLGPHTNKSKSKES
jgi:translation initiation factor IF-3